MPWNATARSDHNRECARYPSDTVDEEWAIIAPMLPEPKRGGRPRTTCMRSVYDAIQYIAASGCQWRMLPKDFPPVSTVQGYFYDWRRMGLFETINQLLVISTRELEGRDASPTAGAIPSQRCFTSLAGQRTVNLSKPPKAAAFLAMTKGSASKVVSATSSPAPLD